MKTSPYAALERFAHSPADPAAIEQFKLDFWQVQADIRSHFPAPQEPQVSGHVTTLAEIYGLHETAELSGAAYQNFILHALGPEWL